jgi:mRNA interferase MazF
MGERYIPDRGHLVWLDFNPQAGHEQAGRRPALVITPENYNRRSRLALLCPVTTQKKGYPFEVEVTGPAGDSVILVDQVRSLDWSARNVEFISRVPPEVMGKARAMLRAII